MGLRTIALGDLRGAALDRADVRGRDKRYTPAEVNEYANQSIAHLRDLLIQARGNDYFSVTSAPIVLVLNQTVYDLPVDCYTLLSARIDLGGGITYPLEPFEDIEEPELLTLSVSTNGAYVSYRLNSATEIEFLPQGPVGAKVYLRYIPPAPRLVDDSDLFDGFNGWEEFVILDAARKICTKAGDWPRVAQLKDDIVKIEMRIKSLATKRDKGRPERVKDVRAMRRFRRFAHRRWGI